MISLRRKFILLFILILIGAGVAGYFWIEHTNKLRAAANEAIGKAQRYDVLRKAIDQEKNRCQEFISQKEGEFGSFEYCKRFIEWAAQNISK